VLEKHTREQVELSAAAESSPGNEWLDDIQCMWIATSLQCSVPRCDSVDGTRARQCLHSARILSHALGPWRKRGVGMPSVDEHAYTARLGEGGGGGKGVHVGRGGKSKRDGYMHGAGCQRRPSGRRWTAGPGHTSAMHCAVTAGE
jgi:hypothetical protein